MSTASGSLSQVLRIVERCIEALALLLCTRILPIRAEGMTERSFPLTLCTTFQLLYQCLARIQICKQRFCVFTPKHGTMLHTRARYSLYFGEICTLVLQPL
jgi:hypothetical protein